MSALKKVFTIIVKVDKPVLVGQDDISGRRQLIPITEGELIGEGMHGTVLPGGIDSQVIRPNGVCELSARYAVRMDDGSSFYIENNGIRTVPQEDVPRVLAGEFVDPSHYYFCTKPEFEVYDRRLDWLKSKVFVCTATRYPDSVHLDYLTIEQ